MLKKQITYTLLKISGVFFIILAILLITGCGKYGKKGQPPMLPEVSFITINTTNVMLTFELPGRVQPYLLAEIRPQVGGIIQTRFFEEGSEVKAGDVLYKIDPAPYEALLNSAQATLLQAEANLETVRLREQRSRELVSIKAISQQNYDDIVAQLKSAEAQVEAAKAGLENAKINLGYTTIKAPISGKIGKSFVTVGALVSAYQPMPLATIQQLDPVFVDVMQASATYLKWREELKCGKLKSSSLNGTKAKLLLENGTAYILEGTLQFADITVDTSTSTHILRMSFPNPEHILLPGMYVRAVIEEGVRENVILVPQQAVFRDNKGNPLVMVLKEDGKPYPVPVELERVVGSNWLVTKGLKEGDRVIMEGIQKIMMMPNVPIKAVPFGTQQAQSSADAKQTQMNVKGN